MSVADSPFFDNLCVWHEAAEENRTLRLLNAHAWGRAQRRALPDNPDEARAHLAALPLFAATPDSASARVMIWEERVAFAKGLCADAPLAPHALPADLPLAGQASPVALFDSYFAREALRIFSPCLPHARALALASPAAVLDEVTDERADFAILPLADSREGKLHTLCEELQRRELRILLCCTVPYPEGGRDMEMALCSHRFAPKSPKKGKRRIACRVLREHEHTLADLLFLAQCCALSLCRLDTESEDGVRYLPVFEAEGADIDAFATTLSLCAPRAQITDVYIYME